MLLASIRALFYMLLASLLVILFQFHPSDLSTRFPSTIITAGYTMLGARSPDPSMPPEPLPFGSRKTDRGDDCLDHSVPRAGTWGSETHRLKIYTKRMASSGQETEGSLKVWFSKIIKKFGFQNVLKHLKCESLAFKPEVTITLNSADHNWRHGMMTASPEWRCMPQTQHWVLWWDHFPSLILQHWDTHRSGGGGGVLQVTSVTPAEGLAAAGDLPSETDMC